MGNRAVLQGVHKDTKLQAYTHTGSTKLIQVVHSFAVGKMVHDMDPDHHNDIDPALLPERLIDWCGYTLEGGLNRESWGLWHGDLDYPVIKVDFEDEVILLPVGNHQRLELDLVQFALANVLE
jgi:hypothetical protein